MLSAEQVREVEAAVRESEQKTSAEIAVAVIRESSDYSRYELLAAIIAGLIFFTGLAVFTPALEAWLRTLTWHYTSTLLVAVSGFSTFVVIALSYFLTNLAAIDRRIVPRRVMVEQVRRRALRQFLEAVVHRTRERNGMLIFLSGLERRIEIVTDIGIADRVPHSVWEDVVNELSAGLKRGDAGNALARAVSHCGEILAGHFPPRVDDINELKNSVQLLGDGS
ncbi:MAG: TPM domain-containing protein [Acidobacteriota bacterium]|jgi:putative membrane protein|nr:TPM domain-containing protein [Acidobacteriota bacterium]